MTPPKPEKTLADYMVIGISPVLIMVLVGSLSFFLVRVFYRGEAVDSVRWVVFWFVLAVVLVSRIGIEQGAGHAAVYGLALAGATWIYLVQVHPAYLLGIMLLGTVWWCAHKLTWDCTLMDDEEDASGSGLLQTAGEIGKLKPVETASECSVEPAARYRRTAPTLQNSNTARKRRAVPHPPGLWVVYFSLVALPLFGIGQMLLPRADTASRKAGFAFLFVYLAAAVGLLLTTSFLGLRRYLRQRYLNMPGSIALGWLKFGAGVAGLVLAAALLLPRPGVNDAWQTLRYRVDYQLRRASEYAARIGPHGAGRGREGAPTQKSDDSKEQLPASPTQAGQTSAANNRQQSQTPAGRNEGVQNQAPPRESSGPTLAGSAGRFYRWFRALLFLAVIILAGWWLVRRRDLILQMARAIVAAVAQFFRDLFSFGRRVKGTLVKGKARAPAPHPFAAYPSPFLTGKDGTWSVEQLIFYSYEALQAWAVEQGIQSRPQQTAREFCFQLGETFPDAASELNRLSFLYGHAAYGSALPAGCDLAPVKKLWDYLSASGAPGQSPQA
jgi:hypothetical protein